MNRIALRTLLFALGAAALGAVCKFMDVSGDWLGDAFSRTSVWVLLCTLIALRCPTPRRAALSVFAFCAGMLAGYYVTAYCLKSGFTPSFVIGWSIFGACTPLMGLAAWYAGGRGRLAWALRACILLGGLALSAVLFDGIRLDEVILLALTGALMWRGRGQAGPAPTCCRGFWRRIREP